MSRIRWWILIFGPMPIVGSSWAVSDWVRSEPRAVAARNDVVASSGVAPRAETTPRVAQKPALRRGASGPAIDSAPAALGSAAANHDELAKACRQTAGRVAKQLGPACEAIVRPPFVVAGDYTANELAAWYDDDILPATRAMRNCYFRTSPTQPISVLLFRNEESYNRYAHELFGESGISVYGYYKPNSRTLLLNLSTGGGTLVHELTHALIDFDFPQVPDWLNEGLASLHEQCRFRTGSDGPWIEGLVNWRLKGLQASIRQGRMRPMAELIEDRDFRGRLVGTNYAQARYFCLYLQRQGLLKEFYRACRDNHESDPRGAQSLAEVLGREARRTLDGDFERWVLELEP